jgi:hypothetical protein
MLEVMAEAQEPLLILLVEVAVSTHQEETVLVLHLVMAVQDWHILCPEQFLILLERMAVVAVAVPPAELLELEVLAAEELVLMVESFQHQPLQIAEVVVEVVAHQPHLLVVAVQVFSSLVSQRRRYRLTHPFSSVPSPSTR